MPGLYLSVIVVVLYLVTFCVSHVSAYTAAEYPTRTTWSSGSVASVNDAGEVVPASLAAINYLGVVTQQPSSAMVEVADSGTVPVLVTDAAGEITTGVRLGLSEVVGAASVWTGGVVVGVAQATPSDWKDVELSNNTVVRVATVQTQLLTEGAAVDTSAMSAFFAAVDRTASGIAGKPVDTWRVVTALLIGLGGLILSFGLLFVSSRESFFSIGRNPMASKIIMGGLWKMVVLSVGIMLITLTAAYLIVRVG